MVNTALQLLHKKRHDGPFRTPHACAPPLLLHSPVHLPQVPCVCARNSSMYPEMCSHAPCINGSWTLPATGRPLLANHCSRHMAGGEEYRDEQVAYDAYLETSRHKFPMLCKSQPLHDSLTLRICDCAPKFRKTLTEHTRYAQNSRFLIYLFNVILRLRDGVGERPKGDVGTRSADCYFVYARSPMVLGLPLTERAEWC